ncbi:unnamed protein product, partial [Amoebophrya sp. A120]
WKKEGEKLCEQVFEKNGKTKPKELKSVAQAAMEDFIDLWDCTEQVCGFEKNKRSDGKLRWKKQSGSSSGTAAVAGASSSQDDTGNRPTTDLHYNSEKNLEPKPRAFLEPDRDTDFSDSELQEKLRIASEFARENTLEIDKALLLKAMSKTEGPNIFELADNFAKNPDKARPVEKQVNVHGRLQSRKREFGSFLLTELLLAGIVGAKQANSKPSAATNGGGAGAPLKQAKTSESQKPPLQRQSPSLQQQ